MVALVTLKLESAAVPPIIPVKVVVPAPPNIVKALAPLIVLLKAVVKFPVLDVMVLVPVKLTALEKVRVLGPTIVMFAPI